MCGGVDFIGFGRITDMQYAKITIYLDEFLDNG